MSASLVQPRDSAPVGSNLTLAQIAGNPELISREQIPAVLTQLAAVQGMLAARLIAYPALTPVDAVEKDMLLTAEQAAPILGVTPPWLYRHAKQLPFARRLSRKVLRFSETGLRIWQAHKKA